jgi:hypothetical protein
MHAAITAACHAIAAADRKDGTREGTALSGWIRIEKGLSESIRFKRVVRRLKESNALRNVSDVTEQLLVTACLGAIARLWNYADSHITDDNRIDATFDEIDDLVGIPGFAAALPSDWLVKVDEETVELPNFLEHNGTSAKQRSDNARRQAEWRARQKDGQSNGDVTGRNASNAARPDQTRPDKQNGHSSAVPTDVQMVFDHWKQEHKHPQAKLDNKRLKLIRVALQSYSAEQLCQSISGFKNSSHHMGQNQTKTIYDSIGLFLRDAEHIDMGLRFAAKGSEQKWM